MVAVDMAARTGGGGGLARFFSTVLPPDTAAESLVLVAVMPESPQKLPIVPKILLANEEFPPSVVLDPAAVEVPSPPLRLAPVPVLLVPVVEVPSPPLRLAPVPVLLVPVVEVPSPPLRLAPVPVLLVPVVEVPSPPLRKELKAESPNRESPSKERGVPLLLTRSLLLLCPDVLRCPDPLCPD